MEQLLYPLRVVGGRILRVDKRLPAGVHPLFSFKNCFVLLLVVMASSWLSPKVILGLTTCVLLAARRIWWLVLQVVVKLFERVIYCAIRTRLSREERM